MELGFAGKVALVTGAGSGIGAAVSRLLGAEGAKVVIADINADAARTAADEICAQGGEAFPMVVDVGKASEVETLVQTVMDRHGGLHLAVNNAGVDGIRRATADYPLDDWDRLINVNLNGVFYCMKYEIAAMAAQGGGAIVNMSSILGSVGLPTACAYTAAKHGIVGLTKVAAIEYAKRGVRINAVGPGLIETPLLSEQPALTSNRRLEALQPMGRRGTPDEVAALVCFLLSERASFISGSYHLVDGAYTAH